ncbi:FAD-binding oxidoreductase [Paenibacillus sp. HN-1]|uniref:NAD(P)/FAD-dependent oxidoreductase n=1 Tax=Paenibacillus TaxID=44249 RepID=UPI001CA7BCA6|nr:MULTISPECIES: FAD-binding oxidoreductase [Paenibacillus]MBY9080496.1 FAD-binding oxidoreductase [Paenibacillus sp. CGMCC 1.18879]MBY9084076.1 FAD-binding oxidoreductase [Paenibacillus sinensis]
MNLISGSTPWPFTLPEAPVYPVLEKELSCECLIIGGGVGGAISAYRLSRAGVDTVLIDKRKIAGGSTHANTGLLQMLSDKSLTACMNTFGRQQGLLFYRLCRQGVDDILALPDDLNIDPHIYRRSSLYYASSEEDVGRLRTEYETLVQNGFRYEWRDEQEIASQFSFTKPAALYSKDDAECNPYRMVHSLIARAAEHGAGVYEHTEALHCDYGSEEVICYTRCGTIRAKHVIFALGYETQEWKKDRGAELINTYAIATPPLQIDLKWHEDALIWETARPYLYFRLTADNRIVAGGRDEPMNEPQRREARMLSQCSELMNEVVKLFPETAGIRPEYQWGAVFGTTHDGLPLIGPHPRFPRCFFVEGYGGNGTVYSMIAARLLEDELAGRSGSSQGLELFSLTRTAKPSP